MPSHTRPSQHSDLPDEVINLAEPINLALLLDHPATVNQAIRFICAARKAILDVPHDQLDPDLVQVEQLISRLYEKIGYPRRQRAYEKGAYGGPIEAHFDAKR